MTYLYKIMVHQPGDVGWEDDSFASGWIPSSVTLTLDGDIMLETVVAPDTYGKAVKSGLGIDASVYRYMIVCLKGNANFALEVYDGTWQLVQGVIAAPADYDVKTYDLAGITTGTITQVALHVNGGVGVKAWYDFVAFSKRFPQFLGDVMEVHVRQRESDVDDFEVLVDSRGPVEDDTVLLMRFEEGLGGKAFDESKYENHGTINGAVWVNGKFGKALSFDGTDDYVDAGNSDEYKFGTGDFAVSFWMNANVWQHGSGEPTEYMSILGNGVYGSSWDGIHICRAGAWWANYLGVPEGAIMVVLGNGSNNEGVGSTYALSMGTWYFIVVTRLSGITIIYVNAITQQSKTITYNITVDRPLYMGRQYDPSYPRWFNGIIDNVRIYDRALTADEIRQIYRRGLPSRILVLGRHIRIWLNAVKVFAGITEEVTPREGNLLHASGRCFGQKLLLRTDNQVFSGREVSLAVKDLVEDLSEVSTSQVETPSPTATFTKDLKYEYISDGLKDLATKAGEDWEFKLGMGHDLRFRSRTSANVISGPSISESSGHVLRGTSKETDAFRLFNKVTVVGGELNNFDNNPDAFTDEGNGSSWTVPEAGQSVTEDGSNVAYGKKSIRQESGQYYVNQYASYDLGDSGKDLTPHKYIIFFHKTDNTGVLEQGTVSAWNFQVRLVDTSGREIKKDMLGNKVNPPETFTDVRLELHIGWTLVSGSGDFDWQHTRYVKIGIWSSATAPDGIKVIYWFDKLHFYVANLTKTAMDSSSSFKHTREHVLRDEKIVDPDFAQEVADALLNVLKTRENRFTLPLIGNPNVQVGTKINVDNPTNGLNGTYYIVEAEHEVTLKDGYVTEVTLEKPHLSLERLLAEAIERKIKSIERGGIA